LPQAYSSDSLLFPPKIRYLFDVILKKAKRGEIIRYIIKAPRGGGKSRLLASLELALWYFLDWDVVNLGGSFTQAQKVYSYLSEAFGAEFFAPVVRKSLQKITVKKPTAGLGKIFVLAATEKQTRSPHVGSKTRGGALVIDEECEAEEKVVRSAIPVVNTAHPSAIIRSSTFHKAYGTFQDTWDYADKKGYTQYEWDIFDVAEKCKDSCDLAVDSVSGERGCILKKYCEDKAHFSEGWVKIEEIRQERREMTDEEFIIELMGGKPSSAGLIYPPADLKRATVFRTFELQPRGAVAVGIDWGFEGETSILLVQEQYSEEKKKKVRRVISADVYSHTKAEEIYDELEVVSKDFSIPIYADKSHSFQNNSLEELGANIFIVSFAKFKDYGIQNIKKMLEDGILEIPEEFEYFLKQMRKYRKDENTGKPIKKWDHGPDALLCACMHFTDQGMGYCVDEGPSVVDPYKFRNRRTGY